jgi:hypothetical protein
MRSYRKNHFPSYRPRFERLESRRMLSISTSFSSSTHTLTITGDAQANQLTIQAVSGDSTKFALSSTSDMFNGISGPFSSPTGVQNITLKMLGGTDTVKFDGTVIPIDITGNLSVDGGDDANSLTATNLTVEKAISVTNGASSTGTDVTNLTNLTVGGAVTIKNGNGNTNTLIARSTSGFNLIAGSVSITNGSGTDLNEFRDTNIGGSVTINNGHADATGVAGHTWMYNSLNTTTRALIHGNVSISYLDGNGSTWDGIWDEEIQGNLSYSHGSGAFATNFDGFVTTLPVIVRGNVTMTGTGANTITVGTQYKHTGMLIGGKLSITTGNAADSLTFNKLEVSGATVLSLGNGSNALTIDDSTFDGTFTETTGADADTVKIDTAAASSGATEFKNAAVFNEGAGVDAMVLDGSTDANQKLIIDSTFIIHDGGDLGDSLTHNLSHEIFPFNNSIQVVK